MKKLLLIAASLSLLSAGFAGAAEVLSSGVNSYTAAEIINEFKNNEEAVKASLKNKPVVMVEGVIKKVEESPYYADPDDITSKAGDFPKVTMGSSELEQNFHAYLVDSFDYYKKIQLGHGMVVVCIDVRKSSDGLQARCGEIIYGPMIDGEVDLIRGNRQYSYLLYGSSPEDDIGKELNELFDLYTRAHKP